DLRARLGLAEQAAADHDDARVIEWCHAALEMHPKNLAALILLVDAQQRQARISAHIEETVRTGQLILSLSPTNVRAQLALARAYGIVEDFKGAVAQYDQLIRQDPEYSVPKREKARILYAAHEYGMASAAYQAGQEPNADEQLQVEINAYAH